MRPDTQPQINLTGQSVHYARIFPEGDEQLEAMLELSASTPLEDCMTMVEGMADIKKRMGW